MKLWRTKMVCCGLNLERAYVLNLHSLAGQMLFWGKVVSGWLTEASHTG